MFSFERLVTVMFGFSLTALVAKYKLQRVAMGFFGGVYNFNHVSWLFRKFITFVKPQLEAAGYTETKPGIYNTRDLNNIRSWTKELAQKVQY